MMTTVLRMLPDIVNADARLAAYVGRCTARPAFKRAFDAQIGDFGGLSRRHNQHFSSAHPAKAGIHP